MFVCLHSLTSWFHSCVQAGDIAYITPSYGHYIENTGDEPLKLLEILNTGNNIPSVPIPTALVRYAKSDDSYRSLPGDITGTVARTDAARHRQGPS